MTLVPDFTRIDLGSSPAVATGEPAPAEAWVTPEGIPVKPVYTGADTAGLDFLAT